MFEHTRVPHHAAFDESNVESSSGPIRRVVARPGLRLLEDVGRAAHAFTDAPTPLVGRAANSPTGRHDPTQGILDVHPPPTAACRAFVSMLKLAQRG